MRRLVVYRNMLDDARVRLLAYLAANENGSDFSDNYHELCSLCIVEHEKPLKEQIMELAASDENPFSLAAEKGEPVRGTLRQAVLHDISIFKEICSIDIKRLSEAAGDERGLLGSVGMDALSTFVRGNNVEAIYDHLYRLYESRGCGIYQMYDAFEAGDDLGIKPVKGFGPLALDDLFGYTSQKDRLVENTKRLVEGLPSQNVLLFGDSGTGKSTMVKAMLPMFRDRKLRLVEVDRDKLHALPSILSELSGRGLYFIIFIDDLSFEYNDDEYKFLKSTIQGSLHENMTNVRFYVTSNRRNIVKQDMEARANEVNVNDFLNETISLTDRFGVKIYFESPSREEYIGIVRFIAAARGLSLDGGAVGEAVRFAFYNGGFNGRSARQFVDGIVP